MANTRNILALFLALVTLTSVIKESTQAIDPGMWMHMKDVKNIKEFLQYLRKKPDNGHHRPVLAPENVQPADDLIFTHEGSIMPGASDAINQLMFVEEDRCEIKTTSVPVPADTDPNVIFWPACVKLHQCSGCCNNEILQCVASKTQAVSMQVLRARYPHAGADYFELEGIQDIWVDRHLECECRCRVQPEHCNMNVQRYDEGSCTCRCFNENDATSCIHPKLWNNHNCGCECPAQERSCYDDEMFDHLTCKCVRKDDVLAADPPPVIETCSRYCRTGFSAQVVDGRCVCTVAVRVQEGMLINSHSPATTAPHVDLQPMTYDRVPDHPQHVLHTVTTTTTQRPPRPSRRPRKPRRGPRRNHVTIGFE